MTGGGYVVWRVNTAHPLRTYGGWATHKTLAGAKLTMSEDVRKRRSVTGQVEFQYRISGIVQARVVGTPEWFHYVVTDETGRIYHL